VAADWWLVVVLVLVAVLVGLAAGVPLGRRQARAGADPSDDLTDEDRPLAAVVVNPTKAEPHTLHDVAGVCAELGWREPLWLETTIEDPGTGQAREALRRGADVVLACGGDGTVRTVAEVLAGTSTAMALIPAGTGNLLARTIGTPLNGVSAATRVALRGDERKIDVGRVRVDDEQDERVFLVMAGTGFDAAIMQATPETLKGRVGPFAYVISGLRAMRGQRTRVTLVLDDGEPLRRRTRTVLIGNSGTLLGGLVLMPRAHIDDGVFDVVNLAPKGVVGWVAVAARVITRQRRGHPLVEHWQAKSIDIRTESAQPAQLDGDPIGDVARLRVRVEPGALIMRVPVPPAADAPDTG
jgi:YegS/Rv2252/BmrU family lipid kinase